MRSILLTGLFVLMAATAAWAAVPQTLNFQGRLTDGDGGAVSDGVHSVSFTLFAHPSLGIPLWSETHQVTVAGGVFSVVLGEVSPLGFPFDRSYWVSVRYDDEPPMTPRLPLTAVPYALGVHESAAVTSLNGLTGDANLVAGSNVTITPSNGDLVVSATADGTDDDWTVVGEDMFAGPSGEVGIGISDPSSKLHVNGDITAGNLGGEGSVYAYNDSGEYAVFGGDFQGRGSEMLLATENGDYHTILQPDFENEGGYLRVLSGEGLSALEVDGFASAGGRPRISMHGQSSVVFDLGEVGDDSVLLPIDSVSASEISNEPGLAAVRMHGSIPHTLTGDYTTIAQRTLYTPSQGYILATSSMEVELHHQGSSCLAEVGITSAPTTLFDYQKLRVALPSGAGQGEYRFGGSPTAIFPVAAGSKTIYLVGRRSGTSDASVRDCQLNLLFVPTAYGFMDKAIASVDGTQGDQDRRSLATIPAGVAEEQRQSERANQDRLEREMADLRTRLDALQGRVDGQNGEPRASVRR